MSAKVLRPASLALLCLLVMVSQIGFADNAPAPKGSRVLGMDVNDGDDHDYQAAFQVARGAGVQAVSLSVNWDEIERVPGQYDPHPNYLQIANAFYPSRGVLMSLEVRPVDTNGSHVPIDLRQFPLDSKATIERFNRFLDWVFNQIPDVSLVSLAIGNEVDAGLRADQWEAYGRLYEAASRHVKAGHPHVKIGVAATFYGLVRKHREALQTLNQNSDVIMVTWYPVNDDFTVKDPTVWPGELEGLLRLYQPRPVYLLEVGYPSSLQLHSSPEKQAAFVDHVFAAWDAHADRIPYLCFSWLTDRPRPTVDTFIKYYHFSDAGFIAYLSTLGLRTSAGADKPGFTRFKVNARARGW